MTSSVGSPGADRSKYLRWALLLLCLAPGWVCSGQARGFDATNLHGVKDLAEGWLVHAGDNPDYARPEFDDSSWTPFNAAAQTLHTLFPDTRPEIVWYRLHVKVASSQDGLALLDNGICRAFEIYSNGTRLLQVGRIIPYRPDEFHAELLRPIPPQQLAAGSIVIAVRVRLAPIEWRDTAPGLFAANLTLGQDVVLREHMWIILIGYNALWWLDCLIILSVCGGSFLLFSSQRDRPEYFWLFLWTLTKIPAILLSFYALFHTFPVAWHVIDRGLADLLGPYCMTRMYCGLVGRRTGLPLQLFAALAGVALFLLELLSPQGLLTLNQSLALRAPLALLELFILPAVMIVQIRRNNRAESLLIIIPLLITGLYLALTDGAFALSQIPALHAWTWPVFQAAQLAIVWPFYISYRDAVEVISMASLAFIILVRSNRLIRQQASLESEIANAREVQQVLLPEAVESIAGFHVEVVYEPAREVGGDFFQILPIRDQGLLVVVGDVAGKGLPAAMLVSVLVGAVRSVVKYNDSPAAVLAELNERMMGRCNGGFATALAALITADGNVRVASAGHLPPYLNAGEIELPAALPLGIVGNARYETTQCTLEVGVRLTFYSDGVVEARNHKGEMFGFDRARVLSTLPASAIANAAKAFGQEDDITVISIERVAEVEKLVVESVVTVPSPANA